MIFALLPVKDPAGSKQRLSALLLPEERERLAWLMYKRTLGLLLQTPGFDRVVVASSNAAVLDHALAAGAAVFPEEVQKGHSSSADSAAQACVEWGAATVAMLPIDIPLATREDFTALCGRPAPRSLVIVPSQDGTGTNALVRTPPSVIESRFGPGSFAAHMVQARQKNVNVEVCRTPGIVFDIDTPDDVRYYLARSADGAIGELLRTAIERQANQGNEPRMNTNEH